MTRFFVRLTLPLLLLFTAALVLIRAQPYHDSQMAVLESLMTDCRSACFMGIYPRQTNVNEAIIRLKAHAWVETVIPRYRNNGPDNVVWNWKTDAPVLTSGLSVAGYSGILTIVGGMVHDIGFVANIELNQLLLDWGVSPYLQFPPIMTASSGNGTFFPIAAYEWDYPTRGVFASGVASCPEMLDVWDTQLTFSVVGSKGFLPPSNYRDTAFLNELVKLDRRYCS